MPIIHSIVLELADNEQLIQEYAAQRGQTVHEFVQDCIKLGILAAQIQQTPDTALIVRNDTEARELLF